MDPFSPEGELLNIHTAMVQAQYTSVLNDYSTSNRLPYDEVIGSISDSDARSTPDLAAVRTYASYLQKPSASAVQEAERLAEKEGDNLSVQLLCGTILARAEKAEQALQLLAKHTGSLDAVALTVQIHLLQNRTDLALQQAKSARSFAQDALLVNLAESWVGMRQGGEQYQKAFYVFEELAQSPASASAMSLVAQAVTELHLGRVEEAETALNAALEMEPENATALANKVVLDAVMGRDMVEARSKLERVDKEHEILADIMAKREAFQAAMAKYSPKFEP
ncbi:hypothetical protein LTR87_015673 [Friedmanniomyces endolithicus]|nr:hypothetical protein LTR87_015673 [Friedmanniomyces endolithicus]